MRSKWSSCSLCTPQRQDYTRKMLVEARGYIEDRCILFFLSGTIGTFLVLPGEKLVPSTNVLTVYKFVIFFIGYRNLTQTC